MSFVIRIFGALIFSCLFSFTEQSFTRPVAYSMMQENGCGPQARFGVRRLAAALRRTKSRAAGTPNPSALFSEQSGEKAPSAKVKVLIAYHSVMGHTAALAKAAEEGAGKVAGVEVKRMPTSEVKCADLFAADAVIVGSPVYWSNMSAEVKAFFDRWTHECNVLPPIFEMKDKIGAALVTAGEASSGKELTLMTMLAAMLGNRMIVLSEGDSLGASATTGEGKAPISEKEIEQGRRLGERVARVALQFKEGRQRSSAGSQKPQ